MMNWAIYLQVSLDNACGNNSAMQRAKVSEFSSNSHLVVTKHLSAERDIRYRVRVVRRHHKYDSLNSESEMEDEDEDGDDGNDDADADEGSDQERQDGSWKVKGKGKTRSRVAKAKTKAKGSASNSGVSGSQTKTRAQTKSQTRGQIPKTFSLPTLLFVALIAFLLGSLLRSLLSPADFIYVVNDLAEAQGLGVGIGLGGGSPSGGEGVGVGEGNLKSVEPGWREIRRLVEVKYIVGGWDFQVAVVRRH